MTEVYQCSYCACYSTWKNSQGRTVQWLDLDVSMVKMKNRVMEGSIEHSESIVDCGGQQVVFLASVSTEK